MTDNVSPIGNRSLQRMQREIDSVVADLRQLRVASLESRQRRDRPPKLPSRKSLDSIVEGLSAALFPNRLGPPGLKAEGIAVHSGHHCTQPILRRFVLEATVRPSLAFYNTCGEVDTLEEVLHRLRAAKPLRIS